MFDVGKGPFGMPSYKRENNIKWVLDRVWAGGLIAQLRLGFSGV
jgi:hypothetical protein